MFVLLIGFVLLSISQMPSSRAASQTIVNDAIENEAVYSLKVDVLKANVSGYNPLLIGTNVTVTGPENKSGVDETGTIVFNELPPGNYIITASETGFLPSSTILNLVGNQEIAIYLTPSTMELTSPTETETLHTASLLWMPAMILVSAILGICTSMFMIGAADRLRRRRKRQQG